MIEQTVNALIRHNYQLESLLEGMKNAKEVDWLDKKIGLKTLEKMSENISSLTYQLKTKKERRL